jgi:hypothetical protein
MMNLEGAMVLKAELKISINVHGLTDINVIPTTQVVFSKLTQLCQCSSVFEKISTVDYLLNRFVIEQMG